MLFAILAASGVVVAQAQPPTDDLSDTPEPEPEPADKGTAKAAPAPTPSSSSSLSPEPEDGAEELGVPAGDMMAPASSLSGVNGTARSSEVRLEFEVEAPLPPPRPTLPPQAGAGGRGGGKKKSRSENSTEETGAGAQEEEDDGSDGSPRYAPAMAAALARFADLPADRVTVGLARGNGSSSSGNSSSNGNSMAGKCGARAKKPKQARKNGACSRFEATLRLNDGEEADNVRQAFAGGDVSGFVDALRQATTPPGLAMIGNSSSSSGGNSSTAVASVESVSTSASTLTSNTTVFVEPTPYNVLFTAIDGTPLAGVDAGGREVVTDGSAAARQPLGGGAIAGIVIGVLAGVLAVFALSLAAVAAVRRRREKRAFAAKRAAGGGGGGFA